MINILLQWSYFNNNGQLNEISLILILQKINKIKIELLPELLLFEEVPSRVASLHENKAIGSKSF